MICIIYREYGDLEYYCCDERDHAEEFMKSQNEDYGEEFEIIKIMEGKELWVGDKEVVTKKVLLDENPNQEKSGTRLNKYKKRTINTIVYEIDELKQKELKLRHELDALGKEE